MNQHAAHSSRLHHTGVTDVINAKPRVDATRTLTGKGSQPHCCYLKRCSQTLRGACRARDIPVVIMHQDAFAADYQEEECRLIGMAIQFSGICGQRSLRRTRKESRDC